MGTSSLLRKLPYPSKDHPHACGDKLVGECKPSVVSGSSPRVWGQGFYLKQGKLPFRIIPTRVGTSAFSAVSYSDYRDHPHACGDKASLISARLSRIGSSPRVWGQAVKKSGYKNAFRIIPTRVGTRRCDRLLQCLCRDHPHACGDKKKSSYCLATVAGSSPRVWGQV